MPIDVKLTVSHRSAHQIAPIFVVAPPAHPELLCLLPINSYTALYANIRLEYIDTQTLVQNESSKAHRLQQREPLHISAFLAPFAVRRRNLFEALLRLRNAFQGQSTYTNPSNSVTLRGWTPPNPDSNLKKIMTVLGERQNSSARIIQKLV